TLAYTDQDVTLTLLLKTDAPDPDPNPDPNPDPTPDPEPQAMHFRDAANTFNQIATADTLESLSSDNALYQHIEMLTKGTARGVFEWPPGEIHATARGALLADA